MSVLNRGDFSPSQSFSSATCVSSEISVFKDKKCPNGVDAPPNTPCQESSRYSSVSVAMRGPSAIQFSQMQPSTPVAYDVEHFDSLSSFVTDSMAMTYLETVAMSRVSKAGNFANLRNSLSLANQRGIPHVNPLEMQLEFFRTLQEFSQIVKQNFDNARDSKSLNRMKIGTAHTMPCNRGSVSTDGLEFPAISGFNEDETRDKKGVFPDSNHMDTMAAVHEECLLVLIFCIPFFCLVSPFSVLISCTSAPPILFLMRAYSTWIEQEGITIRSCVESLTDLHLCVYIINVTAWWFYRDETLFAIGFGISFLYLTSYSTFQQDQSWFQEIDEFTMKWFYLITYCSLIFDDKLELETSFSHTNDPKLFIRIGIPALISFFFLTFKILSRHWKKWGLRSFRELMLGIIPLQLLSLPLLYFSYEYWIVCTISATCYGLGMTYFL